ncbi:MAG: hypothetical protein K2X87_26575 [Gemmataceae bacterium]|nr:hypothetical protein [Gemmataceae bacterium]
MSPDADLPPDPPPLGPQAREFLPGVPPPDPVSSPEPEPPPGPPPLPPWVVKVARVGTDLLFGVIVPLGCLYFDPVVFRNGDPGGGWPGRYATAGYTAAGIGMLAMVLWHVVGRPAGLFAGLLAGGAVFALGLGLVMIPLTIVGLFICIGVFGLAPFGTAWVFARAARRAWAAAGRGRAAWAVVGFVLACGLPWAAQGYVRPRVDRALEQLASADPAEVERGAETLGRFRFLTGADFDDLVWKYHREEDPARREALARAYQRITGRDIEHRLAILLD